MKTVILSVVLFATLTNCFFLPKVKSVDELDITKYLGTWFEMYSSLIQRKTFQKDSYCTTATYSLKPDGKTIKVVNSGRIKSPTGKENTIIGTATRPDPVQAPGEIIVNFPGSPQSSNPNYLVIKLGPPTFGSDGKYEYVIISSPYKLLSWILARDPVVFRKKYESEALQFLSDNGFTFFWNRPRKTYQEDDCVYPKLETDTHQQTIAA